MWNAPPLVLFKAQHFCVFGSLTPFVLPLSSSTELQKPCAGQPTIGEVLEVVLKECRKESLVYKMAALRCAGDVLRSSREDRFSDLAEIIFPLIKKVLSDSLTRPRLSVVTHLERCQSCQRLKFTHADSSVPHRAAQKAAPRR